MGEPITEDCVWISLRTSVSFTDTVTAMLISQRTEIVITVLALSLKGHHKNADQFRKNEFRETGREVIICLVWGAI